MSRSIDEEQTKQKMVTAKEFSTPAGKHFLGASTEDPANLSDTGVSSGREDLVVNEPGPGQYVRQTSSVDPAESPVFIYKRHASLALVKDIAQLHRNILNELRRIGLTDYSFIVLSDERGIDTPLSTAPKALIEAYREEAFYRDDEVMGYLLSNTRPTFRTTIERYIDEAPIETLVIRRNRELIRLWRRFGFLESYLIPVDEDGSTFTVGARNEDPAEVQSRVEAYAEELLALGKVIRHVCKRKFPDFMSPEAAPILINKRPLEVLTALANGCPTVYAVAAELGISLNTANHHIATAKTALGASSLPHAVAIAIRRGLV